MQSAAGLSPGQRLTEVVLPRSKLPRCISAGTHTFLICQEQCMFVVSATTLQGSTAGTQSRTHEDPSSSTAKIATRRFHAPSNITSAAAGGFHFAVSCSNGVPSDLTTASLLFRRPGEKWTACICNLAISWLHVMSTHAQWNGSACSALPVSIQSSLLVLD